MRFLLLIFVCGGVQNDNNNISVFTDNNYYSKYTMFRIFLV